MAQRVGGIIVTIMQVAVQIGLNWYYQLELSLAIFKILKALFFSRHFSLSPVSFHSVNPLIISSLPIFITHPISLSISIHFPFLFKPFFPNPILSNPKGPVQTRHKIYHSVMHPIVFNKNSKMVLNSAESFSH